MGFINWHNLMNKKSHGRFCKCNTFRVNQIAKKNLTVFLIQLWRNLRPHSDLLWMPRQNVDKKGDIGIYF